MSAGLADELEALAISTGFSGAVRVDFADGHIIRFGAGHADRRLGIPATADHRYAVASGTKGFTALVALSLVADGTWQLDDLVRPLLGDDLRLIDDDVTVEHLLAHRSGIGDYFDEDAGGDINDYSLPISVHRLDRTESYLEVLDGFPQREPPGSTFSYNNGGFVVLALVAERAAGVPFEQLVSERVCVPAGLQVTGFLRSDQLPGDAAIGYLDATSRRSNVFHLPVIGSGDGGIYTTVDDIARLWRSLFSGVIIPTHLVELMTTPRSEAADAGMRYGLGCWLHGAGNLPSLEGMDAGVSFRSVVDPATMLMHTTVSNTSSGAWPVTKWLDERLARAES